MTRTASNLLRQPVIVPAPAAVTRAPVAGTALPLPRRAVSIEEQLKAIEKAQAQAEKRVKLGLELYRAAEAFTSQHRAVFDLVKTEHEKLREQLQEDVAASFQTYDKWIGEIEDRITTSLDSLTQRMELVEGRWHDAQARIEALIARAESALGEARQALQLDLTIDTAEAGAELNAPVGDAAPEAVQAMTPAALSVESGPPHVASIGPDTAAAQDAEASAASAKAPINPEPSAERGPYELQGPSHSPAGDVTTAEAPAAKPPQRRIFTEILAKMNQHQPLDPT